MRATLKQRWIEALRSDRYHQGRGHLRAELYGKTFHCAMGVLYDLIATPEQWERLRTNDGPFFDGYLPIESYDQTGISPFAERQIASLNDDGLSFAEIANIVERDIQAEPEVAQYVTSELARIATLPASPLYWHHVSTIKATLNGLSIGAPA